VLDVLLSFVEDSHNSIHDVVQQHDIGLISAQKTLKKINKFHSYKIHLQELFNDDFNRCIEFCDLMMDRNPQF